jgi:hypothetical protein
MTLAALFEQVAERVDADEPLAGRDRRLHRRAG